MPKKNANKRLVALAGALTLVLAAAPLVSAPKAAAAIDAGLNAAFVYPAPPTGRSLNVLSYGATPNNSSNNDVTAIQKAIDTAVAGDEVYIPDGVYDLRGKTSINLKTGVSVRCQSQNAVLATRYVWPTHAVLYARPGTTNLTLSNCRITKASGYNLHAGVRLGTDGSSTALTSRIAVKGMLIEKHQRFGVLLQNTYQTLVEGNTIRNAVALGGGGSGYGVTIDQRRASNNWVRNNTIGPVIRHALLIQYSHHNLLEQNTVTGTVSGAIDMHGEDEYSNEIRYNVVKDCVRNGTSISPNGAGIELGEWSGLPGLTTKHDNTGPNNWVHHNEVYNCTHGLRIMNNTNNTYVEDNYFHHNLYSGIQADVYPLHHLFLLRNTVQNNRDGILLYRVDYATVQGNTVTNNSRYGLYTDAGTVRYTITDNTINNNGTNVRLGSTNGTYTEGGAAPGVIQLQGAQVPAPQSPAAPAEALPGAVTAPDAGICVPGMPCPAASLPQVGIANEPPAIAPGQ